MTEKRVIYGAFLSLVVLVSAACARDPQDSQDGSLNEPAKGATAQLPDGPNYDDWLRGNVFINETELAIMESYPIQVSLNVLGELPTPCDKLAYDIAAPDEDNQIHVDIYSLYDPAGTCIQMIEPFDENISITSLDAALEEGVYTVWVNGELVGEFNYPGG